MAGKVIVRRSMFELRNMQLYFKIITEEKKSHHEEKRLHTVTIYPKATTTDCQVDKMGKINCNKDVWCINFDFLFNKIMFMHQKNSILREKETPEQGPCLFHFSL